MDASSSSSLPPLPICTLTTLVLELEDQVSEVADEANEKEASRKKNVGGDGDAGVLAQLNTAFGDLFELIVVSDVGLLRVGSDEGDEECAGDEGKKEVGFEGHCGGSTGKG
jgi:hypothetical protein